MSAPWQDRAAPHGALCRTRCGLSCQRFHVGRTKGRRRRTAFTMLHLIRTESANCGVTIPGL